MVCILLWRSTARVHHDSRPYRKIDVTRVHIGLISELRKIPLSIQTGLSLINAVVIYLCYCRVSEAGNPHQLLLSPGIWSLWLSQASIHSLWSLQWCHWCSLALPKIYRLRYIYIYVMEVWNVVPKVGIEPTSLALQAVHYSGFSDITTLLTPTWLCSSLSERSVQTTTEASTCGMNRRSGGGGVRIECIG